MVTLMICGADSFCDSSLHYNPTVDLRLFCWEETCVILFFFVFNYYLFIAKKVVNVVNIVLTIEQHLCCYCAELIK